jgi:hypothetical protein
MRWPVGMPVVLMACSAWSEGEVDGLRVLSGEGRSRRDALARVELEVLEGESALLVSAAADEDHSVYVRELWTPEGEKAYDATFWWDQKEQLTNAAFADPVTTFNWPVREEDEPLREGRWEIRFGTLDQGNRAEPREQVWVDAALKQDADLGTGRIAVEVILAGSVVDDASARSAVEDALTGWAALYAAAGLELEAQVLEEPDVSPPLPPSIGSGEVYETGAAATGRRVRLYVVDAFDQPQGLYGMAGSIPGPVVASPVAAVAVGWRIHAGPDGTFSDEETRMFGETMAHEVGHYLGLFHPVEMNFGKWDALSDTPRCEDETACVGELARNLMFPYPVCSFMGGCEQQSSLTDQQIGVMHRYTAVY